MSTKPLRVPAHVAGERGVRLLGRNRFWGFPCMRPWKKDGLQTSFQFPAYLAPAVMQISWSSRSRAAQPLFNKKPPKGRITPVSQGTSLCHGLERRPPRNRRRGPFWGKKAKTARREANQNCDTSPSTNASLTSRAIGQIHQSPFTGSSKPAGKDDLFFLTGPYGPGRRFFVRSKLSKPTGTAGPAARAPSEGLSERIILVRQARGMRHGSSSLGQNNGIPFFGGCTTQFSLF